MANVNSQHSPVAGPRGLAPGYQVTSINGCPVLNTDSWTQCLRGVVFYPVFGHCMPAGKAQQLSKAVKCKSNLFESSNLTDSQGLTPTEGKMININDRR